MSRVTMADVARAVGVNKGTVSRALKGDKRISGETRARIWQTARELGYEVDAIASGLSTKHTGVLAVAVEQMQRPWCGAFLLGVSGVLARFKTELLLFEAGEASAAANVLRRIESRKADGLIWVGDQDLSRVQIDIPIVRVGRERNGAVCCVWLDEKNACARVLEYAQGRKVIYSQDRGSMRFLSELQQSGAGKRGTAPFVISDGGAVLENAQIPDLICEDERLARALRRPCLRMPSRELGALAARVLMNFLHDRGACPSSVLVPLPWVSENGEQILTNSL